MVITTSYYLLLLHVITHSMVVFVDVSLWSTSSSGHVHLSPHLRLLPLCRRYYLPYQQRSARSTTRTPDQDAPGWTIFTCSVLRRLEMYMSNPGKPQGVPWHFWKMIATTWTWLLQLIQRIWHTTLIKKRRLYHLSFEATAINWQHNGLWKRPHTVDAL